jgi:DHA2 family multidrug resistance protein
MAERNPLPEPFAGSRQEVSKWTIAMVVMIPTFIEIMDISVVNVSLPHIQGSLNAGLDEVTWVLTSYLVSNAIVIPISGWLASRFGRKRYLLFSLVLFTASSMLSGVAPSLGVLIFARIIQGVGGGGLQPLSQAILLERFPAAEKGIAMAVFGMGVVLAPILGPVVGGWLTDAFTWRWVFYINLPVGTLALFLVMIYIEDPPYIRRLKLAIDRWGLLFLILGIGALQIVLDKGERDDWFSSRFILYLSILSALSLATFIGVELRSPHPVVNLRVFRIRSFAAACAIMFMGFFAIFGSLVLLPLYLQHLMNYTAFWAGVVLGPGGMASFFAMPIAGMLMRRGVNPRNLLAGGLLIVALSLWMMSGFNLQAGFWSLAQPRMVMGVGMGLFFVPLAASAFVGISKEETGNASGVFNLVRNLGGSFGVAFITTILARRSQVHQNFLVGHINPFSHLFRDLQAQIQQFLTLQNPVIPPGKGALAVVYLEVQRQAEMLAYNDSFWILAWMAAALIPLAFLLRKPKGEIQAGEI